MGLPIPPLMLRHAALMVPFQYLVASVVAGSPVKTSLIRWKMIQKLSRKQIFTFMLKNTNVFNHEMYFLRSSWKAGY